MREGYWVNYRTGKTFVIDEHERWLRRDGNARKLGLPQKVVEAFGEFEPARDRDKFLLFVLKHAPVMRVRGHGTHVSFEYSSRNRKDPMDAVWLWGLDNGAGPFTNLYIVNFGTGEKTSILWKDFKEAMEAGGPDAVMRVASVEPMEWRASVAAELLELSRRLLAAQDEVS